ncbi:gluconate 2-dehydrogenase subunit 3 family protein [Nocardioides marmoraquaticus]
MAESTSPEVVSAAARANLVRLLRAAYPHDDFPDGPYERTADTIVEQVGETLWHRLALVQGLETLDASAQSSRGKAFADLDDEEALSLLRGIEDAEFFRFVRGVTVVTLYNDHEVWEVLGYEGESFSKGGYVDRGFDDLDWLPTPRVEEYDGPDQIVEVAPDDELTTTGSK